MFGAAGQASHLWAWPGFLIDAALGVIGGALIVGWRRLAPDFTRAPKLARLAAVIAIAMPLRARYRRSDGSYRVSLNFECWLQSAPLKSWRRKSCRSCSRTEWAQPASSCRCRLWQPQRRSGCGLSFGRECAARGHGAMVLFGPKRAWIWGYRLLIRLIDAGRLFHSRPVRLEARSWVLFLRISVLGASAPSPSKRLSGVMLRVWRNPAPGQRSRIFCPLKASQILACHLFRCLPSGGPAASILHLCSPTDGTIPPKLGQLLALDLLSMP